MSKHILIVDDIDTRRRIIRLFLESQLEFEVCGEAIDGGDAIEKARSEARPRGSSPGNAPDERRGSCI
jgi:DNA-binding NarL/FixJ family response regulator